MHPLDILTEAVSDYYCETILALHCLHPYYAGNLEIVLAIMTRQFPREGSREQNYQILSGAVEPP